MSEPLLDPGDHRLEEGLLGAGRDAHMSGAAQARLLVSLGIAASGVAVAGKAAAGTGIFAKFSSLASSQSGWIAASVVSASAIGGGVWYAATSGPAPVAPRVVEAPAQPAPPDKAEKLASSAPEEAPAPKAEPAERPSKERAQAASPERPQATRSVSLGDELAVVESASRALRAGNPQAALGRLAEYRQRFPRGKLALEAQVLRIEALARAGRTNEAARMARGFLKRHPNSPVGARIRRYAD